MYQGVKEKNGLCRQLIKGKGLNKADVCYMGDDLPDIAAFHECGLSIAVSDAAGEVCASADLITKKGLVNTDFADVESVLKRRGSAMLGIGWGKGSNKAEEAAKNALNSKFLENSVAGCKQRGHFSHTRLSCLRCQGCDLGELTDRSICQGSYSGLDVISSGNKI